MSSFDQASRGCPWLAPSTVAAYSAASVVRLLDPRLGFASPLVRRLYASRSAYSQPFRALSPVHSTKGRRPTPAQDSRFVGAVVHKLACRGNPAPCSLSVERQALHDAAAAGVMEYTESHDGGSIDFTCQPLVDYLDTMLAACLILELTLSDAETDALLERYIALCTPSERTVVAAFAGQLPDRRLALLLRPQREFSSMLPNLWHRTGSSSVDGADRVDFALEVPCFRREGWLRVAVELDDATHHGAQSWKDGERDRMLRAGGWDVLHIKPGNKGRGLWPRGLGSLASRLQAAVPPEILDAATQFRGLPSLQRTAIHNLILLPLAEGQLTAALADLLYWGGGAGGVVVADPQTIGLDMAVQAACDTVGAVAAIYGIPEHAMPHVATVSQRQQASQGLAVEPGKQQNMVELRYYGTPSARAWDSLSTSARSSLSSVLAPSCLAPDYVEPLLPATPRPACLPWPRAQVADAESGWRGPLHILQNIFRKLAFRAGQREVIASALALRSTLGLLPTAAGKSLCYQLPAMLQPGVALVVAPLRSLMVDQVEHLEAIGVHRSVAILGGLGSATGLTATESRLARDASERAVGLGQQMFVVVSPERLQMPNFDRTLRGLAATVPISYCVVDEAHCISEWGHDFRPSYLTVSRRVQQYAGWGGHRPVLVALTATASRTVLLDITRELQISGDAMVVESASADRPELRIEIHQVSARRRLNELTRHVKRAMADLGWRGGDGDACRGGGLVFSYYATPTVELSVPRLAAELRARIPGLPLETYTGSGRDHYVLEPGESDHGFRGSADAETPAGRTDMSAQARAKAEADAERRRLQAQHSFTRGHTPLLVATHAFGLGIDKPDIRFVIHTLLPRSIEEYHQQIGRAGRDGQTARCVLLFCDDQAGLADELLDIERAPLASLLAKIKAVRRESRGDAVRTLWFLLSTFIGLDLEKALLRHVVTEWLEPALRSGTGDDRLVAIPFAALPESLVPTDVERDGEVVLERALYRLLLLGAIGDYWKDYSANVYLVDMAGVRARHIYEGLESYLLNYLSEGETSRWLPERPKEQPQYQDAAIACGEVLVDYVYATIATRRRRALGQMLQAARGGVEFGVEHFRREILAYLTESAFTAPVRALATKLEPGQWLDVLSKVAGPDDVAWLLGACRRELEDTPSHPGLLLLAGVSCMASPNPMQPGDLRNGAIALCSVLPDPTYRAGVIAQIVPHIKRLALKQVDAALYALLEGDPSVPLALFCSLEASPGSAAHQLALSLKSELEG